VCIMRSDLCVLSIVAMHTHCTPVYVMNIGFVVGVMSSDVCVWCVVMCVS